MLTGVDPAAGPAEELAVRELGSGVCRRATRGVVMEERLFETASPSRRGRSRAEDAVRMTSRLVDLSHRLEPGMFTHPGLPGPEWEVFRSREQYRESTGTDFQIDRVTMVGNTGTYLDSPFHRFADGDDLGSLPLTAVADLPVVVVDARRGGRAVDADLLTDELSGLTDDLVGAAVLLRTDGDAAWGTDRYAEDAPFLTEDGAGWLAERQPALVGIDAVNIDDLADLSRPAHTGLLGAHILVLEHLTNLAAVPGTGARLHAAPLAWRGIGTWPVRAYVLL
jgi:arylformamidase